MSASRPLVVSVVALVGGLSIAPEAAAAPCSAAARVIGDDPLSREVAYELVINGLEREAPEGCPLVRVRVEQRGAEIRVTLSDRAGEEAERTVGEVRTAAAVVASWTEGILATAAPAAAIGPEVAADVAGEVRRPLGGVSLLYEGGFDRQDQRWSSKALAGCVIAGPLCVGAMVRIGEFHRRTAITAYPTGILTGGVGYDLLATVALPLRLGAVVVSPELDVGQGYLQFDWALGPNEVTPSEARGVRYGGRLSAAYLVGFGFSIEVAVALDAMPARSIRFDRTPADGSPRSSFAFDHNAMWRWAVGVRHGH